MVIDFGRFVDMLRESDVRADLALLDYDDPYKLLASVVTAGEPLELYLRKCILDDEVDGRQLFEPLLRTFHDSQHNKYVIPQSVDLIVVHK